MGILTRSRGRRGTSLLEIGICVLLLGIAIIPLVRGQMATSSSTRFTRDQALAAALLSMSLERFRDESPSALAGMDLVEAIRRDVLSGPPSVADGANTTSLPPWESTRAFLEAVNGRFERELRFEVLEQDEGGRPSRGALIATIRWVDARDGSSHPRELRGRLLVQERFPR